MARNRMIPYRGFNVQGPSDKNPNYQPNGIHNYNIKDVAKQAGMLNADTIRCGMNWAEYEPSPGQDVSSEIDKIKDIVTEGRKGNSNLKVMLQVGNVPWWVPGRVKDPDRPGSANYTTTTEGCHAYGSFCVKVLEELGSYAVAIEHSNEPNGLASADGTDTPPIYYARMAAYAAYWIDFCLGSGYYALVGSLTLSGQWNGLNWQQYLGQVMTEIYRLCRQFYPIDTHPVDFGRLIHSIRISFHPYPYLPAYDFGAALSYVDSKVSWLHSNYPDHKIWITECGGSSAHMTPAGQTNFLVGMCYQVCGTKPRVEGLIFWPTTDAEGYAWNSTSGFYKFGVYDEDGTTEKQAATFLKTIFADSDWT